MKLEPPTIHSIISDMEPELHALRAGLKAVMEIGAASGSISTEWAGQRLLEHAESLKAQWQALWDVSRVEHGATPTPTHFRAQR